MGQTEIGAQRVDEAGVGWCVIAPDHRTTPLPRKGAGQRMFINPAMGQQNLAKAHVLALAHDAGLEQIGRVDRAILEQNLAQRPHITRRQRRLGPCPDRQGDNVVRRFFALWLRHAAIPCWLRHCCHSRG